MMASFRALLTSKPVRFALAGAVLVAAVLVGVGVTRGAATYPINVVYSSAPGLFPGAAVDVLGVKVGTVTGVRTVGDKVDVTLAVDRAPGFRPPRSRHSWRRSFSVPRTST
jgi:ABC-type transporter Mla subunit MlaD